MNLKTKVKAYINDVPCGEYTVSLYNNNNVILRITPCEGTGGHWEWHMESLLHLDGWSSNAPSDRLALDFGQGWEVRGMLKVYKEIINVRIIC